MKPVWKILDYSGDGFELVLLFKDKPGLFFLDSSLQDSHRGRYSFFGFNPFDIFNANGKDALDKLKARFYSCSFIDKSSVSPFSSGIVGFLSYDFGLSQENIKRLPKHKEGVPECYFGFYNTVVTIDHYANKVYISSSSTEETEKIATKISGYLSSAIDNRQKFLQQEAVQSVVKSNFTKEQYCQAVNRALDYIARGDIYQVNLSQRFELENKEMDSLAIYRNLRKLSPSYSGAYFDAGEFQILSSSPEQFLYLQNGIVRTKPMKGTRPRSSNPTEDQRLKDELLYSSKDKAELLMITDLERNDLGKVCEFGSIRVEDMRSIETYQTVYQATSTVQGKLRNDKDCFDVLKACFPSGSITGCPKIRSMEIIEELEPSQRGIYTGSLGYVSFSGEMDFNILIRTLLVQNSKVSFHAGSGIVADSVPEQEYSETLVKAKAMFQSLEEYHSNRHPARPAASRLKTRAGERAQRAKDPDPSSLRSSG